ncbi:MAG: hypothetical protein R2856_11365 [Caldilineaceae bacterium]
MTELPHPQACGRHRLYVTHDQRGSVRSGGSHRGNESRADRAGGTPQQVYASDASFVARFLGLTLIEGDQAGYQNGDRWASSTCSTLAGDAHTAHPPTEIERANLGRNASGGGIYRRAYRRLPSAAATTTSTSPSRQPRRRPHPRLCPPLYPSPRTVAICRRSGRRFG